MSLEGKLRLLLALAAASLLTNALSSRAIAFSCAALLCATAFAVAHSVHRMRRQAAERNRAQEALNSTLETAYSGAEMFLSYVPSILIGLDPAGRITRWNAAATNAFAVEAARAMGRTLADCGIRWLHRTIHAEISRWLESAEPFYRSEDIPYERDQKSRLVGLHIQRISCGDQTTGFILIGADLTERRALERELRQAHRMESSGQLAAGIAHEINTPIQYVGDNVRFLREAFASWHDVTARCEEAVRAAASGTPPEASLAALGQAIGNADLAYLEKEVPAALSQALDGVERVSSIVRAMKEFAHPGGREKEAADLNKALSNTLLVARNELKYVADVETEFGDLPPVVCLAAEMNQVFLSLLVNAAHAIGEATNGTGTRGKITIRTRQEADRVVIAISDTGCGIPESNRSKVFDSYFTTKPVGRGTGQGLAIARSIVVDKHGGSLTFEANGSQGTTFVVSLPLEPQRAAAC